MCGIASSQKYSNFYNMFNYELIQNEWFLDREQYLVLGWSLQFKANKHIVLKQEIKNFGFKGIRVTRNASIV